jgi:hypothetical protein
MVIRQYGYITRPFDYILVKVLHCMLIRIERHDYTAESHGIGPWTGLTRIGSRVYGFH